MDIIKKKYTADTYFTFIKRFQVYQAMYPGTAPVHWEGLGKQLHTHRTISYLQPCNIFFNALVEVLTRFDQVGFYTTLTLLF